MHPAKKVVACTERFSDVVMYRMQCYTAMAITCPSFYESSDLFMHCRMH